jgi:hypothetical protein
MTESKVTTWQWVSCVLIVLGQILDAGTTVIGLELGAREENPLMVFLLQWGYEPFIAYKLLLAVGLGFLALVTKYMVWVLIALYVVVVVNNINVLLYYS